MTSLPAIPRHADPGEAVLCDHCGLTVPPGLIDRAADAQYCCQGCRTVASILAGCGLEQYYHVRDAIGDDEPPAPPSGRDYAEMDEPEFAGAFVASAEDGVCATTLVLTGVHCGACVWLIERLRRILPGVIEARVDLRRARVRVVWDSRTVRLSRIAQTLDRLGYAPLPLTDAADETARRREDRAHLVRMGIAGAIAGNVMLLALAMYGGVFDGISAQHLALFRWVSAGLGVLALLWPGRVFFQGAWAAVRTRSPHLDLPIALALAVGGAAGLANTIRGSGEIYFDSLTALVFLLLVGRWLQHRQQRRAYDALATLFTLTPLRATLVEHEGRACEPRTVPARALEAGDIIEIAGGETAPADGVIIGEGSDFDASMLTGESRPAPRADGEMVCAGEINLARTVRVRVTASGEHTRAARLMEVVSGALADRPRIVQLADRIGGWFVLSIVALAALTVAIWAHTGFDAAIEHATALLVVSCPCALGLATPLVYAAALGRLAQRGIMVKGGAALERLARPGVMALDKTGTLTQGRLALAEWWGDPSAQPWVLAMERRVDHPVARAIADGLEARRVRAGDDVGAVTYRVGCGAEATRAGQRLRVGSPAWIEAGGANMPHGARAWCAKQAALGRTPILMERAGEVVAAASLGDTPHPDTARTLDALRARGWRLSVLSGDGADVVHALGASLGGEFEALLGGQSPERKLEWVCAVRDAGAGPIVMVGDGVNDAAALAGADVGIAVSAGAEASLRAADIYVRRRGVAPLVDVVEAARRARTRVLTCLGVSATYNAVAAGAAMAGLISPLAAAVVMPISSMTVFAIATLAGRSEREGRLWR